MTALEPCSLELRRCWLSGWRGGGGEDGCLMVRSKSVSGRHITCPCPVPTEARVVCPQALALHPHLFHPEVFPLLLPNLPWSQHDPHWRNHPYYRNWAGVRIF